MVFCHLTPMIILAFIYFAMVSFENKNPGDYWLPGFIT